MRYKYTNKEDTNKEEKVIYPELSYKIVGCLFEVYNECGGGHRENYYQKALQQELKLKSIKFKEQVMIDLKYKDRIIGKNFLDFLVEDKVIIEIKVGEYFSKNNLKQILDYLKLTNLKLGIIANFANDGLKFYRVLNIQ